MSAFSSLNDNSFELYVLPLSNLSSVSKDTLLAIFNDEKTTTTATSVHSIHSYAEDQYNQCRRARNTAIAKQQKRNANRHLTESNNQDSISQVSNSRPRRTIANFWQAVRSIQSNLRHRNHINRYVLQINDPEDNHRRTTTAASLQTINENDNGDEHEHVFERVHLEMPTEPVYNELPTALPIVPQPMFIAVTEVDQDDEQETPAVTGQTLCKKTFSSKRYILLILELFFFLVHIAAKLPDHEDVVRVLISDNTNMTSLTNSNGQIPLLCSIEAGSTLTGEMISIIQILYFISLFY
jgi:hypothetical protein